MPLRINAICECMYVQNERGDCVCIQCRGNIYSCECPLNHTMLCNSKEKAGGL